MAPKTNLEHAIMRVLLIAAIALMPVVVSAQTGEIRMGRYSLVNTSSLAHEKSPLQVVIDTSIPRKISTIGGSLEFLLLRSGYQLVEEDQVGKKLSAFYQLPLPEVHRKLGPVKLIDALNIITGEAFVPVIDPVHRLVSFELDEKVVRMLGGTNG